MPSLLVVIFIIELVVQLINTIGAATINDLVGNSCIVARACQLAD